MVHIPPGISPEKTIDALYRFTDCEVSISPIGCIIENNEPKFVGVSEILQNLLKYIKTSYAIEV